MRNLHPIIPWIVANSGTLLKNRLSNPSRSFAAHDERKPVCMERFHQAGDTTAEFLRLRGGNCRIRAARETAHTRNEGHPTCDKQVPAINLHIGCALLPHNEYSRLRVWFHFTGTFL
jgi:hypothetical protein